MRLFSLTVFCLSLVVGVSTTGCGERRYQPVQLHSVKGKLLYNGAPLHGAFVRLYPEDPSLVSAFLVPGGRVAEDGSFVLTTYENSDGVPAGTYVVTVILPNGPPKGPLGKPSDRLSGQFADPKKSKIKVTIKEGDTVLDPISITGLPPAEATTNQKGPR